MSTLPLPLALTPENRDTTNLKDARLVNGFWERKGEKEYDYFKRAGVGSYSNLGGAQVGHGVFNWNGVVVAIAGTHFYTLAASVPTAQGVVVAPTWTVSPMQGNLAATPQLLINNGGGNGYYWDSTTLHTIGGFPANTVPGAVYLDETMYVMDIKSQIWASGLEDLATWAGGDYVTAYIEPGKGVALYKQLVYVVAFKNTSVEVFYDAAATPNPLGPVQGAKVNFGCAHAGSIQDIDGKLIWICTSKSGAYGIMQMENVQAAAISTPAVNRLLQGADFTGNVYSWQAVVGGHQLYGVTLKSSNLTLVYDLTSKMWAEWSVAGSYFPIVASCAGPNQEILMQHESDGYIYKLDPLTSVDAWSSGTVTIQLDMYTPNWNPGGELGVLYNQMQVDADLQLGSVLQIRFSDDDYKTWSGFYNLDLGRKNPTVDDLGSAQRRAFNFRHASPTPFRLKGVKMRIDICTL
jgi:hypothetical protein